jgi:hypothetical protein
MRYYVHLVLYNIVSLNHVNCADPVLHMLGLASPWLETDSKDPVMAEISEKVEFSPDDVNCRSSNMKFQMRVIADSQVS